MSTAKVPTWLERDAPAHVVYGEACDACGKFVYMSERKPQAGVLCGGCGESQRGCMCPREMVQA